MTEAENLLRSAEDSNRHLSEEVQQLREQPAAEREKRENDSINFELVRQEHNAALEAKDKKLPKPTTGEFLWDDKYVDERLGRDASWPQIIEAANYSINAEREKVKSAEHQRDKWEQISEELEANRDKLESQLDAAVRINTSGQQQLVKLLAELDIAKQQLAAERERTKPLVDALKLLRYDANGHITAWPNEKQFRDALAKVRKEKV